MKLKMISRAEAAKLYRNGKKVYIGVYTKKEGGGWWILDRFAGDAKCVPHTTGAFEKLARYFNNHYCPGCRTRYAVEVV